MCVREYNQNTSKDLNSTRSTAAATNFRHSRKGTLDDELLRMIRNKFVGSRHKFLSTCGRYIYHIGIIDYLQDFNFDKKGENFLKQTLLRHGPGISAVHPPQYAERFLRFMRDYVI